ncbi:efflux RND transporter permease subunit [Marinilabiliaceae bacterium ANBcel2]|nr:efflux RND transporter permease subunit [Marinilabiliaceae bacterium ANBcel2]
MDLESRENISVKAIKRPIATLSLAAVIVVLGVLFQGRLPVSLLPEADFPHIRVVVNYSGVTPEVIEEQVTRILERNLSATENLAEIHGRASEGRSYIEMYFEPGTQIDPALQDAARQLERARAELPDGIDPPRLMKMDPSQSAIYELAFSSSVMGPVELRDWIDHQLVPQLLTVPGTGSVDVAGGREREIDVVVDPEQLRSYGLTLDNITTAIAARNVDIASGNITSGEYDVLARTESRYKNANQVATTLINLPGTNQRIKLTNVATVDDSHREQRLFARFKGMEAVQVTIMKQPEANTVEIIDGLQSRLDELSSSGFIPEGVEYESIRDESFFIRSSVNSVATAAIAGGLLAMVVIYLFLGSVRRSVIIGLTLPIVILAAFLMMTAGGLTLNVMSLGGLALGVGLLIDNGLVILENIFRYQEKSGTSIKEAAAKGVSEVYSAVIAGTMTNLAAVLPFLLITGMAALIFQELILTISFAILASLFVAVTLVPVLTILFTGKISVLNGNRALLHKPIVRLSSFYKKAIPVVIKRRYILLTLFVAAFVGSLFILQSRGTGFFPPVDDGRITMRFTLPLGTPPEPTFEVGKMIEEEIARMPHIDNWYFTSGGYFRGGQLSIRGGMIDMVVQLTPSGERRGYSAEKWTSEFSDKIDELALPLIQKRIRGPRIEGLQTSLADDDIVIGVTGEDLDILDSTARDILSRLEGVDGIGSIQIGREEQIPQVVIIPDDEQSSDLGVSVGDIGQTLHSAIDGAVPSKYVTGGFEYNIRVRMPRSITGSVRDIENIPLLAADGRYINLGSVASFENRMTPAHIERLNQVRIVRVNITVNRDEATVGEVNEDVRNRLTNYDLPDGYGLVFSGEADTIEETNRSINLAIFLALFFVFVVMAIQYEKLSSPLIIISTLPFAIIGVALIVWLSGIALTAPVLLGVIFLIGIVINNGILLVEFADNAMNNGGATVEEAVAEAGGIRLRPVLMTTLTTVLGMLPLALAIGEGSELLQPLALAVTGGLLAGTFITLVLLPGVYVIFHDIKSRLTKTFNQ